MLELFIVVAIILVLMAIELPNLWRARMAASQAAAEVSLKEIQAAEATYAATYGQGFSTSLAQLGPPPPHAPASSEAAGLLNSLLAKGQQGAYDFVYIPGQMVQGKAQTYTVKAVPSQPCVSAYAYYNLNSNGVTTQGTLVSSLQPETPADILARILGGSSDSQLFNCGMSP